MKVRKYIYKIKNYNEENGLKKTVSWIYNCIIFKIKKNKINYNDFENTNYPLVKKEQQYLLPKKGPKIFIIANIPYYDIGGGQRCSQIAKTFNKIGYSVYYIYGYKCYETSPVVIEMPLTMHKNIYDIKMNKLKDIIEKNDVFIFESPSEKYNELINIAIEKNCKIVYENIDNWETNLGKDVYDEKTLKKLLENSDLLIGTAKPLVNQLEGYLKKYKINNKKAIYLANAVDDELFSPMKEYTVPYDMIIDKKTFLYYGSLWGEWFDWDIIIDLAINNPRYSINLIGDYSNIYKIMKKCPHNIHFLGLKRQIDLPAYLYNSDYALIPFKTGEIGDYVSPLKMFEYISMNKKVLCTNLPDVKGYPNVFCSNKLEEWEKYIIEDKPCDKKLAELFTLNNNWTNRVDEIIKNLNLEQENKVLFNSLSIIILNYNNKNVIFKCIDNLIRYNIYNYEIIVVDNGSEDGSYEELKIKYTDKIKLIRNKKNGCSTGRNIGVKEATKKYIMFLDSDQWPISNYWLKPYNDILEREENIGLIGWAAGFFNKKGYAYHVVDSFPYKYMPSNAIARSDISYLGSGGALVLKSDFNKVNGFDINYDPTCYEDTDFCLKIKNIQKKIYYCPYLGIVHMAHQTTKSGSKHHKQLTDERKKYFKEKWMKKNKKLLKEFIK